MTPADGRSRVGLAARAAQGTLALVAGYGAVTARMDVFVNATLALAVALSPAVLSWRYGHDTDPRLSLWIAVAALVHGVGALGPYSAQSGLLSWYDTAAHAISASFIAGVGYALLAAVDRTSGRLRFPGTFRFVFTLSLILAIGVAWEIVEFAAGGLAAALTGEEVLVQYGIDDIVLDLVFNTLAAAVVALVATGYFTGMAAFLARRIRE